MLPHFQASVSTSLSDSIKTDEPAFELVARVVFIYFIYFFKILLTSLYVGDLTSLLLSVAFMRTTCSNVVQPPFGPTLVTAPCVINKRALITIKARLTLVTELGLKFNIISH